MIHSDDIRKIFGSNVRTLRRYKKLTQEKLAEFLGLDSQSVKFIETGRMFISSDTFSRLCNYFNVEPEYFFKSKHVESTEKGANLRQEINRLLSDCDEEKLQSIYGVIVALKK